MVPMKRFNTVQKGRSKFDLINFVLHDKSLYVYRIKGYHNIIQYAKNFEEFAFSE